MGGGRCRRWAGRRPPWWPEGEQWPPARGSPAGRRLRRRAGLAALVVVVVVAAAGGFAARVIDGDHGGRRGDRGPGPFGLVAAVAVSTVVASAATRRAYRRLAAPAGELVEAADRVGHGDYDVRVDPRGPRELHDLMARFNDMVARLRRAEDQRRRVLADVTHELRTPLMVLQSRIEAQLDGVHPRDDAHLAALLDATRVLAVLVDDLHTLALAEAGRLPLHREPVDPAVLAEDVVAAVSAATEVDVRLTVEDRLPALDADPLRVGQVLSNLLTNALRHTPAGGTVRVRVAGSAGGGVEFSVADEGPGIPADQLETVFEPFARAADTGGSGLGLAISRDIVRAHGGTIRAENSAKGALVSFVLPAGDGP